MEYRVVKAWPSYSIGNTIAEGDLPPKSIAAMLKEGVIEPIAGSQLERIDDSQPDRISNPQRNNTEQSERDV